MEESPCSSFLKFLETVFCDGRLSSGERTLCVLTSATLCEVVAYYLFLTIFLTSCLSSVSRLFSHRVYLLLCDEGDLDRGLSQSRHELTVQSLSIASTFHNFSFSQFSGFSPSFGTSQSEEVILQEIRHQLRHLGLLL